MTTTSQKKENQTSGLAGGRGKETLFRVAARNQIELIAIADNKANIIIGINALIISIIIALLGSRFSIAGTAIGKIPGIAIPFSILLIFSLVSCVLAIFAAKPVIIRNLTSRGKAKSILFFDLTSRISLEEYQEEMRTLLGSRREIYDQMMVEMYSNGMVLKRKYTFLNVAYWLFMIGFISAVLVAFIMSFFSA